MQTFTFPKDFELGCASAATQVDGNCLNSNWYDWYKKGHIIDGSDPDITTRHREHLQEDTELMQYMGIRHYRFGLEWARMEPKQGEFSDEEFVKIREEIELLQSKGITVLVTLHHFSNPMWFENKGGFKNSECVSDFLRLTEKVVEKLGDVICEYITINEPNVYAVCGFMDGTFPPGEKSISSAIKVMNNMADCHRAAYKKIHELRENMGYTDTKVGFAHHMRVFVPKNPKNPWHKICSSISEHYFQTRVQKSFLLGSGKEKGCYADFLGLNYYSRTASTGLADGTLPNAPVNDLGWEIYPYGIVECAAKLHKLMPDKPIYITENGTADNTDAFRSRFIYEHVKALCESGLPVTRYYHWCFVDNFEWLEGFTARFGLVWLDTETLERKIKKSGEFYKQMIENKGVTPEMVSVISREEYKRD